MSNRFLKHRSDENRRLFQKQRNKCISLLQKAKKEYFSLLNINKVVDNKSIWKIVKPFLSNKVISSEKITLIDEVELITDEQKVANILNDFFSSIVTSLKKYLLLLLFAKIRFSKLQEKLQTCQYFTKYIKNL